MTCQAMHAGDIDDLARRLDRLRAQAERRPDDCRAQLAHAEARADYEAARAAQLTAQVADLTTRNAALQRGARRALALVAAKQAFIDRYGALTAATRRARRDRAGDAPAPLLAMLGEAGRCETGRAG